MSLIDPLKSHVISVPSVRAAQVDQAIATISFPDSEDERYL